MIDSGMRLCLTADFLAKKVITYRRDRCSIQTVLSARIREASNVNCGKARALLHTLSGLRTRHCSTPCPQSSPDDTSIPHLRAEFTKHLSRKTVAHVCNLAEPSLADRASWGSPSCTMADLTWIKARHLFCSETIEHHISSIYLNY